MNCEKQRNYVVFVVEGLRSLIQAATDNNVDFVYAISPGLDVIYSDKEDTAALKEKLDQVCSKSV